MAALAGVCGVLIVLFGVLATGRAPSEAQLAMEVTALVGGLVLCFLAVVLARLKALERKIGERPPEPGH
jgi:threonine/homoserine/homoserine lactone efflux protein